MTTKRLPLHAGWDEAIRHGRKTIDARLATDDATLLKVGDVVRYHGVRARIRHIRRYRGFRDLVAYEDWRKIAPEAGSREEALHLLEDDLAETGRDLGVVAFELEPVHE
jgi:ASC-1-like (ASCH) protein